MGDAISFTSHGNFERTDAWLKRMRKFQIKAELEKAAKKGVEALIANTPRDSGIAAGSWSSEVRQNGSSWVIVWNNDNLENGFPVALMLQLGHGTGTGGYVQGRDYINPAMKPIFEEIADTVWKVVTAP